MQEVWKRRVKWTDACMKNSGGCDEPGLPQLQLFFAGARAALGGGETENFPIEPNQEKLR
jgi:hypothetical protein